MDLVNTMFLLASISLTHAKHVGVLFSSFGDVENCECIDSYWPNALAQLVSYEIPTPSSTRGFVGKQVWKVSRKEIYDQYKAIAADCNTNFQTNAVAQSEAVVNALRTLKPQYNFTAYTGYNFVSGPGCPAGVTIVDQAKKALADGVDTLLLVNQNGAQQSNTSIGVAYEQVAPILKDSAWKDVQVLGLDDYSQVAGFEDLLIDFVSKHFHSSLGSQGVAANETCVLLAAHGNPSRISKAGDPYENFVRNNFAGMEEHFKGKGFDVFLAFQNHGGKGQTFPQNLFPWSEPPDTDVVPQIAKMKCTHVLISGVLSFVVDNSETLFDENIDDRRMLNGKPATVTPVFNDDPSFAKFLSQVLSDAVDGHIPVRDLKSMFMASSNEFFI
eukprot:gnl/MRDRNA2_/MRDRNA2_16562_c0_seq1.p1 gnl/MRDRNA2_/MRDRNA2_16562_c0~~gnl/MRDRNA2_/MRDRNA2_16562_c0_seq1.p1  ORF type:complete len:385 (-),score=77.79 gnl/MRDRNA2_/MRDRNA2_16562_c0_seq1:307-1461(-)